MINSILRDLKRNAKKDKKSQTLVNKIIASIKPQARDLANKNWALTWAIPRVIKSCNTSPLCVTTDLTANTNGYSSNNQALNALVKDAVKNALKFKTLNKKSADKYLAKGDTLFKQGETIISGIPKVTTTCL